MKGFALACVASILGSVQGEETYTMEAKQMHTFSNFNSIDVDTTFQMKNENNSLLWMDLATVFEQ